MIELLEKLIKSLDDQAELFLESIELERRISENRNEILELIRKINQLACWEKEKRDIARQKHLLKRSLNEK